jgi:hypothetical protein
MELDFQQIFTELAEEAIDYVVTGGVAVNLHGIPRMTYDIDLMILLTYENINKIIAKLKNWGYTPRAPVRPEDLANEQVRTAWILEKNLKAFSFRNTNQPIGEIDLLIDSPVSYEDVKKRAAIFDLKGVKVPVISIPDLIEIKLKSGRKQDLSDVEHLRSLMEG